MQWPNPLGCHPLGRNQSRQIPQHSRFRGCIAAVLTCLSIGAPSVTAWADTGPDRVPFTFVLHHDPVSASDGTAIRHWGRQVGDRDWKHFECAPVQQHPGTALCLFSHSWMMGSIFNNAVAAIETPRASVGSRNHILGIDLRLDDLQSYATRALETLPKLDPQGIPLPERQFLTEILPRLRDEMQATNIIGTAWGNTSTIEHELLHAQYFTNDAYRQAVTQFWTDELTDKQRKSFVQAVAGLYDTENQDLLINEFQAYTLQSSDVGWMTEIRATVRKNMLGYLSNADLSPVLLED